MAERDSDPIRERNADRGDAINEPDGVDQERANALDLTAATPGALAKPTGPEIRRLADDAVLVVSRGGTALKGGPVRDSMVSFTAVRTPEGWRFASFQNTRIAA